MPLFPFAWSTNDTVKSDEMSAMSARWGTQVVAGAGAGTTTSSTFEDMAGIKFIVRASYPWAYLNYLVNFSAIIYCGTVPTDCEVGLEINGTTTSLAYLRIDSSAHEKNIAGMAKIAPPYTPGYYLASLKWRRASGSGTIVMPSYSQVSCMVREV